MLYLILKYTKSHIYELHALLAGFLAFLLMFRVKGPVKSFLSDLAKRKSETSSRWKENQALYRSRLGLCLIALDFLLSAGIFWILSLLSPLIHFSVKTMCLSWTLSLTIYALYDQLCFRKKEGEQ